VIFRHNKTRETKGKKKQFFTKKGGGKEKGEVATSLPTNGRKTEKDRHLPREGLREGKTGFSFRKRGRKKEKKGVAIVYRGHLRITSPEGKKEKRGKQRPNKEKKRKSAGQMDYERNDISFDEENFRVPSAKGGREKGGREAVRMEFVGDERGKVSKKKEGEGKVTGHATNRGVRHHIWKKRRGRLPTI